MRRTTDAGERILAAAADLFAELGYSGTTTRGIAERAGVNEVTVFRRFESKAGVLRALVERIADSTAGRVARMGPDPDEVKETLVRLARLEIESALANGGLALRLAFDARSIPEVGEIVGSGPQGNLEGLAEYIAERQESGELRADIAPEVIAEAFFGLTSSYVMYRMVLGVGAPPTDVETDEGIEQLFDLFWSGAAAKEDVQ
jgi:AcrR family transcriptional regulator